MVGDNDLHLEQVAHRLHQSLDERGPAYHDHRFPDIHFLELLFEYLLGYTVACSSSNIFRRAAGSEGIHQALGAEHDTITVHGNRLSHPFHGKRTELRDINPESFRGHLEEPAARSRTDPA